MPVERYGARQRTSQLSARRDQNDNRNLDSSDSGSESGDQLHYMMVPDGTGILSTPGK